MVTCSSGWASFSAYCEAGFTGGAGRGLSDANAAATSRKVARVEPQISFWFGNMVWLIIIFFESDGKAKER